MKGRKALRVVKAAIGWASARREPLVLLAVLLIIVGSWGFIELADEVVEGETGAFDRWALTVLRSEEDPGQPIGPGWLRGAARDVTSLGGVSVLTLLIFAASGFLVVARAYRMLLLLVLATLGGMSLSTVMKQLFGRARPDVVPHLSEVSTASFPSGHAMMSAVVYLTLGALIASLLKERRLRVYLLAVAIFFTTVIGLTRVYLGVHYPTDVLAGWTAGTVWALLCWLLARQLQRRGQVESTVETAD